MCCDEKAKFSSWERYSMHFVRKHVGEHGMIEDMETRMAWKSLFSMHYYNLQATEGPAFAYEFWRSGLASRALECYLPW
jgi:hypothetical protein